MMPDSGCCHDLVAPPRRPWTTKMLMLSRLPSHAFHRERAAGNTGHIQRRKLICKLYSLASALFFPLRILRVDQVEARCILSRKTSGCESLFADMDLTLAHMITSVKWIGQVSISFARTIRYLLGSQVSGSLSTLIVTSSDADWDGGRKQQASQDESSTGGKEPRTTLHALWPCPSASLC